MWLLPQPERTRIKPEDLSERVVQLIVEKPKPPPPPPPPEPEEQPNSLTSRRPRNSPSPRRSRSPTCASRWRYSTNSRDLREMTPDIQDPQMKTPVENARSERSLDHLGGRTRLGRYQHLEPVAWIRRRRRRRSARIRPRRSSTARVSIRTPVAGCERTGSSGKGFACPRRSRDRVRPQPRRARRAVRTCIARSAGAAGKIVLEFTIAPTGEITMCRVVSSEPGRP